MLVRAGTVGLLLVVLGAAWASAEEAAAPPAPAVQTLPGVLMSPGVLTLNDAITLALAHHPSLLAAKGATQVQHALVGEARSDYLPQLNLTSDYTRATQNRTTPNAASHESFNGYLATLSLQQRLFDFGKTWASIDSAKETLAARRWDEETSRQTVVLNVKVAYYALLAARRLVRVDEETVRQFGQHLEQTRGFYQAGTRTRFDVTKAEVVLTNAKLDLIKANNSAEVAKVTLANALGMPERPIGELEELLEFKKFDVEEPQAVGEALGQRPELRSLSSKQRAAEASVRSAWRDHLPVFTGSADYTYAGSNPLSGTPAPASGQFPLVWNWEAQLRLTVPIFSGFLTQSRVAEARANLDVTLANEETQRQTVLLEVRQAYLNLVEAEERVHTAELVVRQAEENLELANGRFQAGIGTSIEQTDAQVTLTNAKTTQVQALYDYHVAAATLETAMGRPVP